jgi:hypothetical protein
VKVKAAGERLMAEPACGGQKTNARGFGHRFEINGLGGDLWIRMGCGPG